MEIINHRGKKFIEINGKQFYLQQAFLGEKWGKEPAFLQVYGKVPLRCEDLPDKKWLIVKTRTPGQQKKGQPREYIYTAYDRECFDYEIPPYERKKDALFIGNNKPGSAFVTITSLAKICAFELPVRKALELGNAIAEGKLSIRNLYLEDDLGNAGNTAYRFQFTTQNIDRWMVTAHYLKELFGLEPRKRNGRKKK